MLTVNHVSFVQTDSSPNPPAHVYPFSDLQIFEHPSPATLFPSSHYSIGYLSPLPHLATIR